MSVNFKSWDSPANGTWAGKYKKSYAPVNNTRLTSWTDLDWESLADNCNSACTIALAIHNEDRLSRYKAFIAQKEEEATYLNPEGGAYEGNLTEVYPFGSVDMETTQNIKQRAVQDIIETFCDANNLKVKGLQLLPMIITYIAQFKLTTINGNDYDPSSPPKQAGDYISSKALYKQIFASGSGQGLHYFLMYDSRSKYLETQYKGAAKNFCSLVPIVLYAFKLIKGVPYSHWSKSEIRGIVNPKLVTAMLWDEKTYPKPPIQDILNARTEGLMVKSGAKAGTFRSAVYTFKLYGSTAISHLPEYVQVMYSQIWCAHPENRTKYMILDPSNWDNIPAGLIETEVLNTPTNTIEYKFGTVNKQDEAW